VTASGRGFLGRLLAGLLLQVFGTLLLLPADGTVFVCAHVNLMVVGVVIAAFASVR
jgi:hypothetical protein